MAAHLEPAYSDHPHGTLPVTEMLTTRSLILPLFHEMTEEQQNLIASVICAHAESSTNLPLRVP